jgi:PEP-CTERM/exosortase A-associated glycosyltransferase
VDGFEFYRTPPANPRSWRPPIVDELAQMRATERRLTEAVRQTSPDILHAHSPVLTVLPALRVGRHFGVPVVYEIRAFWEDAAVSHGIGREGDLRYRVTRALETHAVRRADAVTTICEGLRRDLLARGLADDKVTVIPNAVDPTMFDTEAPIDLALRKNLGLDGRLVIGFIGSYYAYEGLSLLLEALPAVRARFPAAALLLVGGGPEEADLKIRARALRVDGDVMFAGRVPNAEVQRYYGVIDVLAYPRLRQRLTELVTPLKPLEAMAAGRLFVASDVGGHRELIRDGETGTLFRAGDVDDLTTVLVNLMDRRDLWPERLARARHFVEVERTWKASVERYVDVYGRVLVGRPLRRAA